MPPARRLKVPSAWQLRVPSADVEDHLELFRVPGGDERPGCVVQREAPGDQRGQVQAVLGTQLDGQVTVPRADCGW
jgi:hypothetical protein